MNIKIFGKVFFISKAQICFVGCMIAIPIAIAGYFLMKTSEEGFEITKDVIVKDQPTQVEGIPEIPEIKEGNVSANNIHIYIVGAVENPGLYEISSNSMVYDAIEAAGGVLDNADVKNINMALRLERNLMLKVLTGKERETQGRKSALVIIAGNGEKAEEIGEDGKEVEGSFDEKDGNGDKININTADIGRLTQLPGIGEKRAKDIIDYRESSGKFKKKEDIMNVKGIKESVFNSICDLITV